MRFHVSHFSQESVPPRILTAFYGRHEEHALLPLHFPDATVVSDTCSLNAVLAYQQTFIGQDLKATGVLCLQSKDYDGSYARAQKVARDHRLIIFPIQSADACLIAAYAMLKCESIFNLQCWSTGFNFMESFGPFSSSYIMCSLLPAVWHSVCIVYAWGSTTQSSNHAVEPYVPSSLVLCLRCFLFSVSDRFP